MKKIFKKYLLKNICYYKYLVILLYIIIFKFELFNNILILYFKEKKIYIYLYFF